MEPGPPRRAPNFTEESHMGLMENRLTCLLETQLMAFFRVSVAESRINFTHVFGKQRAALSDLSKLGFKYNA
jgi:hypothetical protein